MLSVGAESSVITDLSGRAVSVLRAEKSINLSLMYPDEDPLEEELLERRQTKCLIQDGVYHLISKISLGFI